MSFKDNLNDVFAEIAAMTKDYPTQADIQARADELTTEKWQTEVVAGLEKILAQSDRPETRALYQKQPTLGPLAFLTAGKLVANGQSDVMRNVGLSFACMALEKEGKTEITPTLETLEYGHRLHLRISKGGTWLGTVSLRRPGTDMSGNTPIATGLEVVWNPAVVVKPGSGTVTK